MDKLLTSRELAEKWSGIPYNEIPEWTINMLDTIHEIYNNKVSELQKQNEELKEENRRYLRLLNEGLKENGELNESLRNFIRTYHLTSKWQDYLNGQTTNKT